MLHLGAWTLLGVLYKPFCNSVFVFRKMKQFWTFLEGRKEIFYLTTHSTHFIYGYMGSDIWYRTIQIAREETRCRHMGYSFRYASSHRQDYTYHGLCYTSRGALAGTRNISMKVHHEGSIRRPMAPWADALTTELHLSPLGRICQDFYMGSGPVLMKVFMVLPYIVAEKWNRDILGESYQH